MEEKNRGRSSVWLECLTVDQEVASSSLVGPAISSLECRDGTITTTGGSTEVTFKTPAYTFLLIGLIGVLLIPECSAQGRNDAAVFVLDFELTDADTQFSSTIEEAPVFQEDEGTPPRTFFNATLVLKDAVDLIGINCDLIFDPAVLQVVEIHESLGDLNFDGRSNIADILVLGERFNQSTSENGYAFFDRSIEGTSAGVIDVLDIQAVESYLGENPIYWTSNSNYDLTTIKESVEIFESPEISNANGKIDDIVAVLLSRAHPVPDDFGFNGDARIADITFEVVGDISGGTEIRFEDTMAVDEGSVISLTDVTNASSPSAPNITIIKP